MQAAAVRLATAVPDEGAAEHPDVDADVREGHP
ncbi:MAG: hypothetical protein AVDCRST_MAG06-3348 [uncultured Nocardioides sp.]|uniref:Uncharacterized protein n=1 Tax=uncultured Nocardioides sp. TaxID=198441 RepID=A0A6J4PKC6_9ACTN|nr:MAG: hypothetical protein AVDCRST_MAG06-3348 [uncultured Nocardioides sp.]